MAQYLGELADYHFTLVHKSGTLNRADAFSRWPDHDTGTSDNEDIVVLGPELFANATKLLDLEQNVFAAQEEHRNWIEGLQGDFPLDKVNEKWSHRRCVTIPHVDHSYVSFFFHVSSFPPHIACCPHA